MCSDLNNAVAWSHIDEAWREVLEFRIEDGHFAKLRFGEAFPVSSSIHGSYLIPGLIDAHVHVTENPTVGTPRSLVRAIPKSVPEITEQVLRNINVAARAGITTLRDMGSLGIRLQEIVQAVASRKPTEVVSRILSAGSFLTRAGGHAADRGLIVGDIQTFAAIIDSLKSSGAAFIKVMNDPIVFSISELDYLKRLCLTRKLPLCVHVYTSESAELALDANADVIEHAGDYNCNIILRAAASGTPVVTTFVAALDTVLDPIGCCADDLFPDTNLDIFKKWYAACCASIPRLYHANVPLVCGTDAGFPGTDFDSLPREIVALKLLGIPIAKALKAATVLPARILGFENELGSIAEGAIADYCVFGRNPLMPPSILRKPSSVFCEGKSVSQV